MRTDNMDEDPLVALERRVRRLERGSDLGYSSISEGSLRIASADGLIVEGSARVSGVLLVTGTETVDGTLQVNGHLIVAGELDITGPTVMSGTFQVDGETTINGRTVVNGDMDINGALNLAGTLNVTGGGKIQAGAVVIDGTDGGRIAAPGATLSLVAELITMLGGVILRNGGISEGDFVILEDLTVSGNTKLTLNPGSGAANLHYEPSTRTLTYLT